MEQMQTYVVTGGNSGLGFQCAPFLAADCKFAGNSDPLRGVFRVQS